jgi:hypothetical protein
MNDAEIEPTGSSPTAAYALTGMAPTVDHDITLALWQAWCELNTIRARDGVPYTVGGYTTSVTEDYFSKVVDDCEAAIEKLTGEPPKPWPPKPK